MTTIFFFGASITYGVGGEDGGWPDQIKRHYHKQMYGLDGIGEQYETYLFAKPGATVEFVLETYAAQLEKYRSPGDKVIAIISVGLNNAKAVGAPDNFVSSVKDYIQKMQSLLSDIAARVDHVVCVGFMPVDQLLTAPKASSPDPTKQSYFYNNRVEEFNSAFQTATLNIGDNVSFINLFDRMTSANWTTSCLYTDGLHPNADGHTWIYEQVILDLEPIVKQLR
jgi:lysophospholipase L1-like esterase